MNEDLIKSLRISVNEAEQGRFLAASLIAARAILYALEQIPGASIDDKVKNLREKDIIDKKRSEDMKLVIEADKAARNIAPPRLKGVLKKYMAGCPPAA